MQEYCVMWRCRSFVTKISNTCFNVFGIVVPKDIQVLKNVVAYGETTQNEDKVVRILSIKYSNEI
jgi:hypothetical protein